MVRSLQRFLGVCVVEIDDTDIADAQVDLDERFPNHRPGAAIVTAALDKARDLACNPGGEVLSNVIPPEDYPRFEDLPRGRLLRRADLTRYGF